MKKLLVLLGVLAVSIISTPAMAKKEKPPEEFLLVIKEHKFEPEELIVPAGEKIKLIVHNQDSTPEEFESYDLKRERIIGAGKKTAILIGPLDEGEYSYFGEFNMDTAKGKIIAK